MTRTYTIIFHDVLRGNDITPIEYIIADTIHKLCSPGKIVPGWCVMSRDNMATTLGYTKRGLQKAINRLAEKGLVEKGEGSKLRSTKEWEQCAYGPDYDLVETQHCTPQDAPKQGEQSSLNGGELCSPKGGEHNANRGELCSSNNNIYNNTLRSIKKEKKSVEFANATTTSSPIHSVGEGIGCEGEGPLPITPQQAAPPAGTAEGNDVKGESMGSREPNISVDVPGKTLHTNLHGGFAFFSNNTEKDTAPAAQSDTTKKDSKAIELAKQMIDVLNEVCGKRYSHKESTLKWPLARIRQYKRDKQELTLEMVRAVVEYKQAEWGEDPQMKKYLQPSTLFGGKFDQYLDNAWMEPAQSEGELRERAQKEMAMMLTYVTDPAQREKMITDRVEQMKSNK